jgi:hypothetical protein
MNAVLAAASFALFIVHQPPCATVSYERVSGPFADKEVCEQYRNYQLKHRGPLSPGQTYECRPDRVVHGEAS